MEAVRPRSRNSSVHYDECSSSFKEPIRTLWRILILVQGTYPYIMTNVRPRSRNLSVHYDECSSSFKELIRTLWRLLALVRGHALDVCLVWSEVWDVLYELRPLLRCHPLNQADPYKKSIARLQKYKAEKQHSSRTDFAKKDLYLIIFLNDAWFWNGLNLAKVLLKLRLV